MQPAPLPSIFRATAVRELTRPAATVQPVLVRALLVAGFVIETQMLTVITAQRGSKYAGAGQKPDKIPMTLSIRLTEGGGPEAEPEGVRGGCTAQIVLQDRWSGGFGRTAGLAANYRTTFESIIADLDRALADMASAPFAPMECSVPAGLVAAGGPSALGRAIDRTNQALEATPGQRRPTPTGSVTLVLPEAYAEIDWTELQAMMTAGLLIATRPGALPERLAGEVGRVVATLETAAPPAGASPGTVQIELDAAARPVIDFLSLQSELRGKLPLRTLQVCTTCRLEKVINPDFQKLQAKNRRLRILSTTVGGAISPHGVSAFLLIGRLAQLKLLDPDFVCPRCQGMTAESSLVTFCPRCGDRRAEAALRDCPHCKHDLRTEVTIGSLWEEGKPPVQAWSAGYGAPAGAVSGAWASSTVELGALPPPVPGTQVGGAAPASEAPPEYLSYPPPTWYAGPQADQTPTAAQPAAQTQPMPAIRPQPVPAIQTQPMPAIQRPVQAGTPPPAWHADPHGRHELRWWDGTRWTEHVFTRGVAAQDPV